MGGGPFLELCIAAYSLGRKLLVDHDAPVVDFLIQPVQFHLAGRDGVVAELFPDLPLGVHITDTVGFEPFPRLRGILRAVAGPPPVGLGGLAGHGEVAEQSHTFLQLFPLDVQHLAHPVQGEGKGQHRGLDGGTLPGHRGELPPQVAGDTRPLERGVESRLGDGHILQCFQHPVRELLPAGQIDHLGRFIVKGIGKEEDLKQRGICVGVDSALRKVHIRKGLDVDCQ